MFERLGRAIARHPYWFILIWSIAVAGGAVWMTVSGPVSGGDVGSFLPPDAPSNQALALINRAFPQLAAHSLIAIIAHRPAGLTGDDFAWLSKTASCVAEQTRQRVLSPAVGFLRHRLVSPDQQAAMIVVNLPTNFISTRTAATVHQVEQTVLAAEPPAGLTLALTGTATMGRDYAAATQRALHNTTWVTVVAVLVILVLVYRSPVGALVPLVAIGASVYLAFVALAALQWVGWDTATMERIFAVVLIFGAGVDFAMFWIAGYREALQGGEGFEVATVLATRRAGPAILASAATTICGLLTMMTTELVATRSAGRVLAAVLTIALLAALTLTPALARVLGRALFWPLGVEGGLTFGQRVLWPRLAHGVTRRPRAFLWIGLAVLACPAVLSSRIPFRFDSLSELPPGSPSARGFDTACRHFAKGQLYSNSLLLEFERLPENNDRLKTISEQLASRIAALHGVYDVYSLGSPLGRKQARAASILAPALTAFTKPFYLSESPVVLRWEILLDYLPFSPEAMAIITQAKQIADEEAAGLSASGQPVRVLMSGPTPYVLAVRDIAGRDQLRVMVLATAVIALIVLMLVRDLPLTTFMVLATWLTYGATLMLSQLFFVNVLGQAGLDWKVRLTVFVIIVAVGQDYNIFLVTRLMQEPAEVGEVEAARRAIVGTGSVISSCGIIMAATLGSLWAGGLLLLRQIGFALALGILIDTFFVRPLLLPSFCLATGRLGRARRRHPAAGP